MRDGGRRPLRRSRAPDARRFRPRHRRTRPGSSRHGAVAFGVTATTPASHRSRSSAARPRSSTCSSSGERVADVVPRDRRRRDRHVRTDRRPARGLRRQTPIQEAVDARSVPVRRAGLAGRLPRREWRDKARKIEDLGYSTLVHARSFRRGARAAARDRDGGRAHDDAARRLARVRQRLQAPGDPRQGGGDDRPPVRRSASSSASARAGCGPTTTSSGCRTTRPPCASTASKRRCTSIKQCFTGEPFTHPGEHYRITDYASWPKPVQKPGPPILIGGGGKRVLSIAGARGRHRRHQPEPARG